MKATKRDVKSVFTLIAVLAGSVANGLTVGLIAFLTRQFHVELAIKEVLAVVAVSTVVWSIAVGLVLDSIQEEGP